MSQYGELATQCFFVCLSAEQEVVRRESVNAVKSRSPYHGKFFIPWLSLTTVNEAFMKSHV